MQKKFKGCLLGAAIGDALGMPNESASPNLNKMKYGYRRPYKGHPNDDLKPGQYTDDTQLMILVGTLLADRKYNEDRYATALRELYLRGALRFPDGSISAACERMEKQNVPQKGVKSTTSGCLPVAVPFALTYPDMNEACERAVRACNITHSHPAAHAAVSTVVTLIYHALHELPNPVEKAMQKALSEDDVLGGKIRNALSLEREGMETETALLKIGNDVSVFQTLPIAFFLISRYTHPPDLLTVSANTGGNTDTIALICGAFLGASKGMDALPEDLLKGLEDRDRIELLGQRLFSVYSHKSP
ncbi:MAG: ADP-ribosylglycohydrolase family protein [Methanoregula sp.]|uniref:ADP-ribosylglycohydrolase family protein n=1 Tax=Methanoregula sp. TaxID=2052170 RepID=UPI0025D4750C|nr:ADP-ribosylglycohydrolase family protein [Methanoregula sp.]MCK9631524.1 ADP-ribosylglycohydrolase family protein [Methanoregula sp.]